MKSYQSEPQSFEQKKLDVKDLSVGSTSIKIFKDLAKSRKEFRNVGRISFMTENSEDENYIRYDGFRVQPSEVVLRSSGVYIGKQIVITAGHCIPDSIENNKFNSSMTHYGYFITEDEDEIRQFARILMVIRHSEYLEFTGNDIALLLLDREIINMDSLTINFKPIYREYDCTSVGFTNCMTMRTLDNKRIPLSKIDKIEKVATKIPELTYYASHRYLINTMGFSTAFRLSFFNMTVYKKRAFDGLESGIYPGMSGGGCFSRTALIGINSCNQQVNDEKENHSHIAEDRFCFVPLFYHKSWIQKTEESFKMQLPAVMAQSEQWYLDRETYEKKKANTSMKCLAFYPVVHELIQSVSNNPYSFLMKFYKLDCYKNTLQNRNEVGNTDKSLILYR